MSRKNQPMDTHFQKYNMRIHLRRQGLAPDLIDVHSLLDRSLYYPENVENFDRILGLSSIEHYGGGY